MKTVFDARYPAEKYPVALKSIETVKNQVEAHLKEVISAHADSKGQADRGVILDILASESSYETLPMVKNMIAHGAARVGADREKVTYDGAREEIEKVYANILRFSEPNGQLAADGARLARLTSGPIGAINPLVIQMIYGGLALEQAGDDSPK